MVSALAKYLRRTSLVFSLACNNPWLHRTSARGARLGNFPSFLQFPDPFWFNEEDFGVTDPPGYDTNTS